MESKKIVEATKALQKYLKEQKKDTGKSQLFEDGDAEPLFLVVVGKRFFSESKNLRPRLVKLPHRVWGDAKPSICLFSRDPQGAYKDALTDRAGEDKKLVDRVVGLSKLKGKFKQYEARRMLKSQFELFLAEPEVLPSLPSLLGKTFYGSQAKVPLKVQVRKGDKIEPEYAEAQIEKVLDSTPVFKTESTITTVRVGNTDMKPKQVAENVKAVVEFIKDNLVTEGMDGLRSLSIKSLESPALPIYYSDKYYDENDIGTAEDNKEEGEAAKRKREMEHLDALLKEVVDEEEIVEYNREEKRRKKGGPSAGTETEQTEN